MAKVKLNPTFREFRGRLGDLVYRKNGDGIGAAMIGSRDRKPPTEAQQEVLDQFRAASAFAKRMVSDPVQGPRYAAAAELAGRSVYGQAMTDFLRPPEVHLIDTREYHGAIGNVISVTASDELEVTGVDVTLRDAAGTVLEQGAAVATNGEWRYTATVAVAAGTPVTIEVEARGFPGNSGRRAMVLNLG